MSALCPQVLHERDHSSFSFSIARKESEYVGGTKQLALAASGVGLMA